jgi:hypothetical protein
VRRPTARVRVAEAQADRSHTGLCLRSSVSGRPRAARAAGSRTQPHNSDLSENSPFLRYLAARRNARAAPK